MRNRIILSIAGLMVIGACQMAGIGAPAPEPAAAPTNEPAAEASSEETTSQTTTSISYEGLAQEIDRSGAVGLAIGDASAPVTLVEYADFSCPHCYNMYFVIGQMIGEYASDGRLRVVLKPISFVNPPYSAPAAQAALCAAEQGKGWEMVDQIWDIGSTLGTNAYDQAIFDERVETLGLNVDAFDECFTSPDTAADVQAVIDEAAALGIKGVPALFINEKPIPLDEDMYEALIKEIEAQPGK